MTLDAWLFDLDPAPADLARLADLLDAGERNRAARFRFERDRQRFVARRGQLRRLLARYLDRPAAAIAFTTNAYGKPALHDADGWHFNLSHSGGLGLCVVDRIEIGCDLERRDPRLADRATAVRFFAPAEVAALDALPPEQWTEGFFNCWTRKEAYVKALGLGLSCLLDSFVVTLAPAAPAALLTASPGWAIHAFTPAPGYHAAIVLRGETVAAGAARWFAPFADRAGRECVGVAPAQQPARADA